MAITIAMPVREPGRVIENPLSGERIFIPELSGGNMARLSWDLFLAPGGHVPNSHVTSRFRAFVAVVRAFRRRGGRDGTRCDPTNYNQSMRWQGDARCGIGLWSYLFWGAEYWLAREEQGDSSYLGAFRRVLAEG